LRHSSHRVIHLYETEMKMQVGYARTSTLDQTAGFEAQLTELAQAGCEKVFREQVSSVAPRAQLEAALEFIREGDVLVICKLDRLARSTQHLLEIVDRVKRKGAHLNILNLGMDTSTATGKLLLTVIGAIGQFEREMMLERQREGIAKAKTEGKYKGRAPTARAKAEQARALRAEGIGATEIAKRLNMGRASVYRVLTPTGP
jgi:DNA invertase Pin-like site-specific DNA recombinase